MKISKKNQDPHQTDTDRAEIEKILSKKSEHFAVGTYIVCNYQRGLVLEHLVASDGSGINLLRVEWDHKTETECIAPIALNR